MQLSMQNFSTLLTNMAASVQGAATGLLDLSVGSVLRAILEANAALALWMQWLMAQCLATTRLATSAGTDADSFGADFGFTRLPAVASIGSVTFARFSPSIAAQVPVGTLVSTAGNTASFVVIADPSNTAYSAAAAAYDLAAGVASVTVAVTATVPGGAGNVQPSAISVLSSAIAGIDTVTNQAALTGGMDAEADTAFRARFGSYLASLSRATNIAIGAAIAATQQGLSYTIEENINQAQANLPGHFVVTVDDGSGYPPAALLSSVQSQIDAIRPVGTSFAVQGPTVVPANVAVTLAVTAAALRPAAVAAVASAFEAYIAGLPVGATLSFTRLAQLAYGASDVVTNLSGLSLNGGSADLAPPVFGAVRTGSVTVA
jgi:uncharacterized phage protein gp47/JayE